ncbi:putative 3-hydroxyacyl-CoA dehydrogenase [Pseudomassariella vexata]|uniref:Putative 3-hydroxyacyl-CoA dehydrogenase n=1 Tax=Pseudomassariella vexata TaxID=1141098 RepID=A0A1Y2DHN8_9PEZI|nr:putative 3-hydroxyacyl-CoA dehydrogenase [Pseudomassariella vexata]ORY58761.1 putative 3-hydroxyacyl-CoA dehydrogenase [Pseudomassariella vexata]
MSLLEIPPETFAKLKEKVVVITGATTGIGAVFISQLETAGSRVIYGDIKEPKLASDTPNVKFVKTDVTVYESVLNLFKTAWSNHGRIDHAITNAGVVEIGQLFNTGTEDAAIEEAPPTTVIDVNLKGTVFFTRVAVHYLRKSLTVHEGIQNDASILLMSSSAGFGEYPGLFQYSASKHGVMGLFRSTRNFLLPSERIRINVVLPNVTRTQMVTGIIALYDSFGVPCNDAKDVSNVFFYALGTNANGEAWYVSGGKIYEIEKKLETVKSCWLGESVYDEMRAGQQALGNGSEWVKSDQRREV